MSEAAARGLDYTHLALYLCGDNLYPTIRDVPPGKYRLGEVLAEVGSDGYVRLPGTPYLAGSALTMDRAIENAARFAGLALEDALRLANRQPRTLFPEAGAGIAPGERADLVVLREGPPLTVVATIVEGEVVYRQS